VIQTPVAERRLVTVLFADVVDSTSLGERMDPEDWGGAIHTVLALASAPVERYGGTVARLMGDGLLAVFGAPAVHEDDAVRAVQAALEMIAAVGEAGPRLRAEYGKEIGEGLHIRVGINSGLAIVEGLGGDARDVNALGDTVNVAARMQGIARPDSVIVTGETWRQVSGSFRASSLGGAVLKGKAEPIEAWEIFGRRDEAGAERGVAGLSSPMVGRDEELQQLLPLLGVIAAGRGRAAMVLGEPGVGKSRLLAEFRTRTQAPADVSPEAGPTIRWIEGRASSYGENVPFGLLGELVTATLGVSRAGAPADRLRALDERTRAIFPPDQHEDAFATLGHLLSLPLALETIARFAPLSPEALRIRYLSAAQMTIRHICSRGPTVVAVEDAHWADASSVEVVSELLPIALELPVLFLLTSRPERAAPGWRIVETARETFGDALVELPLSPLAARESRRLVANLLEIDSLPDRLRDSILERAEGNPFFMEELIRMLIERGWVVRSGDRWVGSGTVAEAEVPDTLRGLLLARIDRLPAESRRTLRVAAVIGRDVPVTLLDAVTGDPAANSRALGLAEAAGLLRFAATGPEPAYRFRHVLIQEAAYDSLLKADRRRLHLRVGEALEEQEPERREELAPILGLHFERAREVERAVDYLRAAGRQAVRRRALREARELLDRAAALLDDAPETPEFERRRIQVTIDRAAAGVTFQLVDHDLALLADAVQRAERLGDERLLGLVLARQAGTQVLGAGAYHLNAGRVSIERAVGIGRRLDDAEILALPRALQGLKLVAQGRRREAIKVLHEAVELLSRFHVNEASFYAGQLAITYAQLGEFADAEREVTRAREMAELSGDPTALADARIFTGVLLGLQGRHEEAAALAREGFGIAGTVNELVCQTAASGLAGEMEMMQGNLGPAIEWLEKSVSIAHACSAVDFERIATVSLKVAQAMAGEGRRALDGFDGLLEETRASGDPAEEARALMSRAAANATIAEGDRALAKADLEAAIPILKRLELRPMLEAAEQMYARLGV